jgi:hypothetical protein
MVNLHSSMCDVGNIVTQIVHFDNGSKKTFRSIITSTIVQGQFTKFKLENGSTVSINDSKVLCIETFPHD